MSVLSQEQIEDLREIQRLCQSFHIEVILVGAQAYRMLVEDIDRQTRDIDVAVALEMEEWERASKALDALVWVRDPRMECRWRTPRHTIFDIVPAGAARRGVGSIIWPRTEMAMSLGGFECAFRSAVDLELAPGFFFKVMPPAVFGLLKMASYLDNPERRERDLGDIRELLRLYDEGSDRVFSDEVLDAGLSDIEFAGAFLLGSDLRRLCADQDRRLVGEFLARVREEWEDPQGRTLLEQLAAFEKGFRPAR